MPNTNFFNDVYEVVKLIPHGRVTSYGAIASYLGAKSSARMVGWALNSLKGNNSVPAHRVVNRQGILSGQIHFGHASQLQSLLEAEGLLIENNQVVDFANKFWDPAIELSI